MRGPDFWQLIERAREAAGDGQLPPTGREIGEQLTGLLAALPLTEILAFHREHDRVAAHVDRWEFCAACYLISGHLSDDSFGDFKSGLIGLGRDTFERILADPDDLADV